MSLKKCKKRPWWEFNIILTQIAGSYVQEIPLPNNINLHLNLKRQVCMHNALLNITRPHFFISHKVLYLSDIGFLYKTTCKTK